LCFRPNILLAGRTYVLQFEARDPATPAGQTGGVGFAIVIFTTNSPPYAGTFSATPNFGAGFSTQFKLQCRGWLDQDDPLFYTFKYVLASDPSVELVSQHGPSSSFSSVLPAGVIKVVAEVRDSFGTGAATRVALDMAVSEPPLQATDPAAFAQQVADTLLRGALDSGDTFATAMIVQKLASLGGAVALRV
jgi:hypothetical protein